MRSNLKTQKMKQETLIQIKQQINKLYNMYVILTANWNGKLLHGNDATYPITIIVEVLLQNMAFDGSNCKDYSLQGAIDELYSKFNVLKELNEYNNKGYMTHFPFMECEAIIDGCVMSEEDFFTELDIPLLHS